MPTQPKKEILDYDFPQGISLIEANAGTGKTFSIESDLFKSVVGTKNWRCNKFCWLLLLWKQHSK